MKEVDTNWTAATAAGKAELDCIWAAGKFYASEAAKPLADLMMNTLRQFNLVLSYVNKSLDNFEAAIDTSVVELKSHPQLAQA
jgi:hypothetical protein